MTAPDQVVLRPITEDEFDAQLEFVESTFHATVREEDRRLGRATFEVERSLGLFEGDRVVGSAAIYSRDLTVPGGPLPVACVTWVAVAPDRTRRGLLTRMMRHQLTGLHEQRGEPVAALWASESAIYGRYGYGLASQHARLAVRSREVRLRPGSPAGAGTVRVGEPAALRADLAEAYEKVRPTRVGHLDRRGAWWDHVLADPEHHREGASPLRAAVHDGAGGPDGYALFAVAGRWDDLGPDGEVRLRELHAATPEAEAALWRWLLELDLTRSVVSRGVPADCPLLHLVDEPRRVRATLGDGLWVRLVDVDRALEARAYAAALDAVLEVTDPTCRWNEGRWRLVADGAGASCTRTDAEPDLALSSTELGAAYLGGTTLASLAAAGRVRELRPGALRAASLAFGTERPPYCPEVF